MRCDWANDPDAPRPCRVIDLDTGEQLTYCAFADEETGEYRRWRTTADGQMYTDPATHRPELLSGRCRLQIQVLKEGEPYLLPREAKA
jgi:hypothetical protein